MPYIEVLLTALSKNTYIFNYKFQKINWEKIAQWHSLTTPPQKKFELDTP